CAVARCFVSYPKRWRGQSPGASIVTGAASPERRGEVSAVQATNKASPASATHAAANGRGRPRMTRLLADRSGSSSTEIDEGRVCIVLEIPVTEPDLSQKHAASAASKSI